MLKNLFKDKKFKKFDEKVNSESFYNTENGNIYVVIEGGVGTTVQEITPNSCIYAAYNERCIAVLSKNYHVTLKCSEEYDIKTCSTEEAERIAREQFGCDYLIDDVIVREEE